MKTAEQGMGVAGLGWHVPGLRIDNETISRWSGADPGWVIDRTGVEERRYAASDEPTSALAARALSMALEDAGLRGEDLAGVIVCTSTPDQPQPPTAAFVLARLGLTGIPAFDLNGVCAGFLYGLGAAEGWRRRGPVALIGADKYSSIVNPADRRTVSLFGDGAGAVILEPPTEDSGLVSVVARCQPEYLDLVRVRAGGSALPLRDTEDPLADRFEMEGRAIVTWAETALPVVAQQACEEAGLTLADIDRFVLHQGSPRMVELCTKWLGAAPGKVALSADRFGNTGAASIPLTLAIEVRQERIKRGDRVMLAGLGGGTAACASVVKW
ncbi:3-oxoacyl-ACP synthase III family protein [[Kitasatospora] papulosa]|uniref:3-oxoacyl-ACP synthase III family protein n=1 Tax=[Kitasatospora] papulosa TaxID=1464011 RepID=UPI00403D22DC